MKRLNAGEGLEVSRVKHCQHQASRVMSMRPGDAESKFLRVLHFVRFAFDAGQAGLRSQRKAGPACFQLREPEMM